MAATQQFLLQQYYHVALPRDVPGEEDRNLPNVEGALLDRMIRAVKELGPLVPFEHQHPIDIIRMLLTTSKTLNADGYVHKDILMKELSALTGKQALFIHVTKQNAALLVYKHVSVSNDDVIVFEAFETSAVSEKVLSSENALQWDFPGHAISVPSKTFSLELFQASLATFVEQASIETIEKFTPVTYKAAASLPEIRDTTDPTLITGLLMTILEGNGQKHEVPLLQKRIRDTVSFKGARKPWRRSPFYLALRVAIQRHLYQLMGPDHGRFYYKMIMAVFLCLLLNDSDTCLPHDASFFLMQKLGRRLAKIEQAKISATNAVKETHEACLPTLDSKFKKAIARTKIFLEQQWNSYRESTRRPIRRIPQYVDMSALTLQLRCSWDKLCLVASDGHSVISEKAQPATQLLKQYQASGAKTRPFITVADRYMKLASTIEEKVIHVELALPESATWDHHCCSLAHTIEVYTSAVNNAYDNYPEMKSRYLLDIMELWVAMDRSATSGLPLLESYHPGFEANILDSLELLQLKDLKRVHEIQTYLIRRCHGRGGSGLGTIFDIPSSDSFAVAYYDAFGEPVGMHSLRAKIEADATKARDAKEEEWRDKSEEHEQLMQEIVQHKCTKKLVMDPYGVPKEVHPRCQRCKLFKQMKGLKIQAFEWPLPKDENAAKAAIFELRCPEGFSAYRDATWLILGTLGHPPPKRWDKVSLLRDYRGVARYNRVGSTRVTLGSKAKSHYDSHYGEWAFPVGLRTVCPPCGLRLEYFDTVAQSWIDRQGRPSFSRHFQLMLPANSPYQSLQINHGTWPSSNEIIASQTKCPPDLNVYEFMAWQGLLSLTHCRWLSLLRELGATNLNFSTESTWAIVSKLVLQVGPGTSNQSMRDIHVVFEDKAFCTKLLEQIHHRLNTICQNWRESVQMDTLITILHKALSLSPHIDVQVEAANLLSKARNSTWAWCLSLRSLTGTALDDSAIFLVWASALCKRAVQVSFNSPQHWDSISMQCSIRASVVLQENLVSRFDDLPLALRNLLLQDLLYNFQNRHNLWILISQNFQTLLAALDFFWPLSQVHNGGHPDVRFLSNGWWVEICIHPDGQMSSQLVHYNVVLGDLLIDGKPSGFLPMEYQVPIIYTLFGTQALRVRPSNQPGMTLFIDHLTPNGDRIHLGFRHGQLVVRAVKNGVTMELVPKDIFGIANGTSFDLPQALVDNCYHWLNLNSKTLEIRQDDIWRSKASNWKLDLRTRQVTRKVSNKISMLVDPYSPVAQTVAQNFTFFEYPNQIMVVQQQQSHRGWRPTLCVELNRLELSFVVKRSGLLLCHQLNAEIVPMQFQDAGVWYGLRSKIVLRSAGNPRKRILLVPEGDIQMQKCGLHVTAIVRNKGTYLKYDINDVLGRLDCPAEPRLLYTKALWHAHTSFILPDPLTGRTGCEVALSLLESGLYKPWAPLNKAVYAILVTISNLSPRRTYYPENLKCMEVVQWRTDLTVAIQDERYRAVIQNICERSDQLQLFQPDLSGQTSPQNSLANSHLEARADSRAFRAIARADQLYTSRGRFIENPERINAATITKLLAEWPIDIANTQSLGHLLQEFLVIGGSVDQFDQTQLSELLALDLGAEWGRLVQTAIKAERKDRFHLMFMLVPMSWSQDISMELLKVLVSYAVLPELKSIEPPRWPSYLRFKPAEVPTIESLADIMKSAHQPHVASPSNNGVKGQLALKRIHHEGACRHSCLILAKYIRSQWPLVDIDVDKMPILDSKLLDTACALELVRDEWQRLARNFEFSSYIQQIQAILDGHTATLDLSAFNDGPCDRSLHSEPVERYPTWIGGRLPTIQDTLRKPIHLDQCLSHIKPVNVRSDATNSVILEQLPNGTVARIPNQEKQPYPSKFGSRSTRLQELSNAVRKLRSSKSFVQRNYGEELEQSIDSLQQRIAQPPEDLPPLNAITLQQEIVGSMSICTRFLHDINQALEDGDSCVKWLKLVDIWPRMNNTSLLSQLRSTSRTVFGQGTKETLIHLGVCVTNLQRLLRIEDASRKNKQQQLKDERMNRGHENWDPFTRPDWLLLEIDSDIMFRAEQVEVANATISPASRSNSVVQLLMGKGKTSCILPMVAAILADKRNLLRIIVPRPLLLQSAQVLQIKLGGLLGREVIHIPFSRRTKTDSRLFQLFGRLHGDIKKRSGVMLSLPENILSFQLSGLQRLCDGKLQDGQFMVKMQEWLHRNTRDVLDECDVSLAIRTQLIYPSGSQLSVDGHPLRWQTVQAVLRLLRSYLPDMESRFPRSIEVVQRMSGGYPLVYLLRHDAEEYIVSRIVEDVCRGQLPALPCAEFSGPAQDDVRTFISSPTMASQVVARVNNTFKDKQHLLKMVHLLRGLFVHRILLSTLKKRWNVQYGLHPTRDPIAVPYLAKGVPSPTSEWGHPDVAIILTCLSFYYQGIDMAQFKQAFEQLLKADEPGIEYEKWATESLPENLRDYTAINVEDLAQLRELHQYVRYNVYLLDFYLNNFVFPRHAKQFDMKLQASGWDLVHFDPLLGSSCKTTGFSGTNDSRHQLPMTIKQNDLPNLRHTNAEVLAYLLENRNRRYFHMIDGSGHRLSEEGLLGVLAKQGIRILIDAGAQILEHDNYSLIKAWLRSDAKAVAGVCFDHDHRPWVFYRNGKRVPLLASPFAENLGECVVYLDESHCRGTDLKLPPTARAALTLGPHVTKDAVAQAAMRLRLLGQSQSVTFFSPPEVHQSILDLHKKSDSDRVGSSDVIAWLLEQSCNAIEQLEPLYINQGNTFIRQVQAKLENEGFLTNIHQRCRYLSIMRTKESQTLQQLYAPKRLKKGGLGQFTSCKAQLRNFAVGLEDRKMKFQDRSIAIHSSALEEVEQEREVEHEVETVRDLEKPIHFTALKAARLHEDIKNFAKSGNIVAGSQAYHPMFSVLQSTATGRKHGPFSITSGKYCGLFISVQFTRTVKVVEPNDNFIRPCQWILWSNATNTALVVSPEEADALLPLLRRSHQSNGTSTRHTHMLVYSAPVTRRGLHFNNLDYYAVPPLPSNFKAPSWLKIELGIFSGRLYFEWNEYRELLAYLREVTGEQKGLPQEPFVKKPLTFLHDWLAVLRKGQDFEHTPMGFATTGKPLMSDHPFFLAKAADESDTEGKPNVPTNGFHHQEEEGPSEDDDDFDDHEFHHEDDGDHYSDAEEEEQFDEGENAFFDAPEYIEGGIEEGGVENGKNGA